MSSHASRKWAHKVYILIIYEFAVQKPSTVKNDFFEISVTVKVTSALYACQLSCDPTVMLLGKVVNL